VRIIRVMSGLAAFALLGALAANAAGTSAKTATPTATQKAGTMKTETQKPDVVGRVVKSNAEWKKILSPEQYHVLREQGTEIAFTGKYWNNHAKGVYRCAACGLELFSSDTKFDSGTGWPSFWAPIAKSHIKVANDASLGMQRDEVECARCDGHLGHVFDDGPAPTGLRYCLDSVSLQFEPAK